MRSSIQNRPARMSLAYGRPIMMLQEPPAALSGA